MRYRYLRLTVIPTLDRLLGAGPSCVSFLLVVNRLLIKKDFKNNLAKISNTS